MPLGKSSDHDSQVKSSTFVMGEKEEAAVVIAFFAEFLKGKNENR